jgi:hypothetical protein
MCAAFPVPGVPETSYRPRRLAAFRRLATGNGSPGDSASKIISSPEFAEQLSCFFASIRK